MQAGRPDSGVMSLEDILNHLYSAAEMPPHLAGAWDGPYLTAARAATARLNAERSPVLIAAAAAPQQGAPSQTRAPQATRPSEPPLHDFQKSFLTQLEPDADRIAKQYNLSKNHLLGLSAYESDWFRNPDAIAKNNPFGINIPGTKTKQSFKSIPEAFDYWGRLWGPAVSGATTPNDFITRMQSRTIGKYNSENPQYNSQLEGVVNSAIMRDRQWEQMGRPTGKTP